MVIVFQTALGLFFLDIKLHKLELNVKWFLHKTVKSLESNLSMGILYFQIRINVFFPTNKLYSSEIRYELLKRQLLENWLRDFQKKLDLDNRFCDMIKDHRSLIYDSNLSLIQDIWKDVTGFFRKNRGPGKNENHVVLRKIDVYYIFWTTSLFLWGKPISILKKKRLYEEQ